MKLNAGLYVVGTPIGNLGDITLRALETLKAADLIAAEDTRHTRKLLDRYEIRTPVISCHKFNEAARAETVLGRIRAGAAVALVTDSGMPAVSDPGSRVVAACREAGLPVTVLPGPSSVTAAVALCGFAGASARLFDDSGRRMPFRGLPVAQIGRPQETAGRTGPGGRARRPFRVAVSPRQADERDPGGARSAFPFRRSRADEAIRGMPGRHAGRNPGRLPGPDRQGGARGRDRPRGVIRPPSIFVEPPDFREIVI